MSGALTQLAAIGAQDANLTVQPEITFFKAVWKRHTNFAIEAIEQEFSSGDARPGSMATAEIPRSGDLVSDIWVKMELAPILDSTGCPFSPEHPYWVTYVDEIGHALIKKVKVDIGGHPFDAHTSEYLHCYNELTKKSGRVTDRLIGKFDTIPDRYAASGERQHLYVPLRFWFNENTSQALPLVALMYHKVSIQIEFRNKEEVVTSTQVRIEKSDFPDLSTPHAWPENYDLPPDVSSRKTASIKPTARDHHMGHFTTPSSVSSFFNNDNAPAAPEQTESAAGLAYYYVPGGGNLISKCNLLINYIFLDADERKLFATMDHHYLIDTLQIQKPMYVVNRRNSMPLQLNHPVKELIWAVRPNDCVLELTPKSSDEGTMAGKGLQRWSRCFNLNNNQAKETAGAPQINIIKNLFNFTGPTPINTEQHAFRTATLKFNNNPRFEDVDACFLHTVHPAKYHSSTPRSMIYNYSFATDPEDWKPTGSVNMSRIDEVQLELDTGMESNPGDRIPPSECFVFARSLNIMKIKSGMAGLTYAN